MIKMMPDRFETVDRGDNQDDGCGVVEYDQATRDKALRDWKYEVISMVTKHQNLRYYTEYTGSNDIVYVQVADPNSGSSMNMQ